MGLEAHLHQLLADSTDLADVRVYPVLLPEEPQLPAITYQRISTTRSYTTSGPVALNRVRIQFDCWSHTYAQVKQLQAALLSTLEDRSLYADTNIDSITLITAVDGYEQEARLYRVFLDFYINVTE